MASYYFQVEVPQAGTNKRRMLFEKLTAGHQVDDADNVFSDTEASAHDLRKKLIKLGFECGGVRTHGSDD